MEPSGRKRWQPLANATAAKAARMCENRCRGLRPVAAENAIVKEGVDGSSPSASRKARKYSASDGIAIPIQAV
jgi:hypothetical protein